VSPKLKFLIASAIMGLQEWRAPGVMCFSLKGALNFMPTFFAQRCGAARRLAVAGAALLWSAGALAQTPSPVSFDIKPAPTAQRGKMTPVGPDGSRGVNFVHERGWYIAHLPAGAQTRLIENGVRMFTFRAGGGERTCSVQTTAGRSGRTFDQLQARIASLGDPGHAFYRQISGGLAIADKGVVPLGHLAAGKTAVKIMALSGTAKDGGAFMTWSAIEVPAGQIVVGCDATSAAQGRTSMGNLLAIAEGAMDAAPAPAIPLNQPLVAPGPLFPEAPPPPPSIAIAPPAAARPFAQAAPVPPAVAPSAAPAPSAGAAGSNALANVVAILPTERGKTRTTAAGLVFAHERGWYTATLPQQGKVNPPVGNARTFLVPGEGEPSVCRAVALPTGNPNLFPLPGLQARVQQLLTPGSDWDKSAASQINVQERSVITLAKSRIAAAAFSGPPKGGTGYLTMAVVEAPKGNLVLGCTGATLAKSKALTASTFRLGSGAVQ
jgi:hypothetical protein